MGEHQQQKHTLHAPCMKTECGYLYGWIRKWSHMQKISPKMVKTRDIAGNVEEEESKLQQK